MNKSFISITLLLVILNLIILSSFNSLESYQSFSYVKPMACINILSFLVIVFIVRMVSSRFKKKVNASKNQINQLVKSINNINGTNISLKSSDNSSNSSQPINNSNNGYGLNLVNKFNQDLRSNLLAIANVDLNQLEFTGSNLGKGDNGSVKKAKYMGNDVAVKTGFKFDRFTVNEIKCHSLLAGHKNIIDIEGCYDFEMTKMPSLVLEIMDMNLIDYLLANKSSLGSHRHSIYRIMYEVIDGLKYMHYNDFVHCDLHPGNILIKNNSSEFCPTHIKISDFGYCKYIPNDPLSNTSSIGCKLFMSPESITGGRSAFKKTDDIYSLAVMSLLMFNLVYYGRNCDIAINRFQAYGVSALEIKAAPELEGLIRRCIGPVFMRPSIEEFEDEFKKAGNQVIEMNDWLLRISKTKI